MRRILIIYPDQLFLDFIERYFLHKRLHAYTAKDGATGFNIAANERPDLIICNRELPHLDLKGFMIKKRIAPAAKHIPLFLLGNFSPKEIMNYKAQNVKAFVSFPINPQALLERICLFFDIDIPKKSNKDPMLVDIHAKGNIIIIQIESTLEEDKLDLLNYQIRTYCHENKINKPRFLFIIPSVSDESITEETIKIMFEFIQFEEFTIKPNQVKILSTIKTLINMLKQDEFYSQFELVDNYYEGVQKLNISFDMSKDVPIDFLKTGCSYIFDLYDNDGMIRIPALTVITDGMLNYLKKSGERKLTYYSDKDISEIVNSKDGKVTHTSITDEQSDLILADYKPLTLKGTGIEIQNEKMSLFFQKLKGLSALVISKTKNDRSVIKSALDQYIILDFTSKIDNLHDILDRKKYILVFIDNTIPNAVTLLQQVREFASRRRVSVIIMTKSLNRTELETFRKYGTEYILISPFSTSKLMHKVFHSISSDRKT